MESNLPRLIEPVGAVVPLFDEPQDQTMPFGAFSFEQNRDVVRQRIERLDLDTCNHGLIVWAEMNRIVVIGSSGSGKTTFAE